MANTINKEMYLMLIYIIVEGIIGLIGGILLAACTKRKEGTVRRKLDNVGEITNYILLPLYVLASGDCSVLGILCHPNYDGFLGFIGWIMSIIVASVPLVSGLGLGASVALRKRGKSKLSFIVQFAGIIAVALAIVIFTAGYGRLLAPIPHPNT